MLPKRKPLSASAVRDYLPLQQGLRPPATRTGTSRMERQRLSSTTTRIKTLRLLLLRKFTKVRDYLPLQQGLRQSTFSKSFFLPPVRDYLPLQQGLRLNVARRKIKLVIVRDYLPLQQGLRLKRPFGVSPAATSETIFHYNKD